jgi:hypothetical protein
VNKDTVDRWIEALESGEYQQGYGALRQDNNEGDTYCCLGVLCDVVGVEWRPAYGAGNEGIYRAVDTKAKRGKRSNSTLLPVTLSERLGLGSAGGYIIKEEDDRLKGKRMYIEDGASKVLGKEIGVLTALNDQRYSFKEIAAVIRATYYGDE